MGPKKRKVNDLKQIAEAPKSEKKSTEDKNSKLASQSSKVKKHKTSKYFKNKEMDPCKPSTSGIMVKKSNANKTLNANTNEESIADNKAIEDSDGTATNNINNKELDLSGPSTSGSSVKEVVVDKSLNVNTVKLLIKEKEAKKTRALKRIADLPPIDLNENSKNMLNLDPENQSNKRKKKSGSKIKCSKEVAISKFPNVTKFVLGRQVYGSEIKSSREIQNWCVSKRLQDFKLLDRNSFVEARITTLTWNQNKPQQVAFSDKHGHIVVGDLKEVENSISWKLLLQKNGIGPGGNTLAMKFAKSQRPDHYILWSVGLEGIVVKFECPYYDEIVAPIPEDSVELNYKSFLPTNNYNIWYPCMDIDPDETLLATGCTKGFVQFMTLDGKLVENFKASKGKLHHVEFCRKNPMLFVTASLNKTVNIWDRRYIKSINDHIAELPHNYGLNSAYFNEKCDMLLTTDQYDEIRTYDTSTWRLLTTIKHPHRQFRHLTPIKATWHPSADIIVAGRYPEHKADRCVDVMSADGDRLCTLDSSSSLIQSVARFSPDGKYLLSSIGCGIEVWGTRNELACSKQES